MNREKILRRRILWLTGIFMAGLILSGATAIPLVPELTWLRNHLAGGSSIAAPLDAGWRGWLWKVWMALTDSEQQYPFLFYGTDWLAFGHFVIAIAFIGALRDPVRNRWLFDFGLLACALVIPFAVAFGAMRGMPYWWRLIDCSFGAAGFLPLWFCRKWAREIERGEILLKK